MRPFIRSKSRAEAVAQCPGAVAARRPSTPEAAGYGTFKKTELVTFSIRVQAGDLAVLRDHLQRIDVPISQGVRQLVLDYMSAKGLR
jgi:hypothetical protein